MKQILYKGCDISHWQGKVDFEKLSKAVDFVILKCGGSDNTDFYYSDRNFDEYYAAARYHGLKIGAYWFVGSTSTGRECGFVEAKYIAAILKHKFFDLPIYIDFETGNKKKRVENTRFVEACACYLEQLKYFVGIYSSDISGFKEQLDYVKLRGNYSLWVARYGKEPQYAVKYDMWQYTDRGRVMGINALVDRNIAYKDFEDIIVSGGYNNYTSENQTYNYKVGDHVNFDRIFISSDSTIPLIPYMNHGVITRIEPNKRNPYLVGEGIGWINNDSITSVHQNASNVSYEGDSFVNALKEVGIDHSFENRKRIASLNGITNYKGDANDNLALLKLLKEGQLKI